MVFSTGVEQVWLLHTNINPQDFILISEKVLEAPAHWLIQSGESPTKQGPDVQKVPLWQHLLARFGNYTQNATSDVVLPSYLEVPFVVEIQGFEELIRARDVRDHLKFSLPTPETNVKWFLKPNNRQRRNNDIYSSVSRLVEVIFAFSTWAEQLWSCGQRQQLSQLRTRNADNTTDFMWKTIQSLAEFISHILLFDYLSSIRHNDKFIRSLLWKLLTALRLDPTNPCLDLDSLPP